MQQTEPAVGRLAFESATHAPVRRQYRGGDFETIGDDPEPGMPWRRDPETGAEIHAIQGGEPHAYSTDLKVGSSYPATVFVFADDQGGDHVGHDDLERFLRDNQLWSDAMNPVVVPDVDGLRPGFQYRPPDRAPTVDRLRGKVEDRFDLDEHELLGNDRGFQAFVD